MVNKGEQLLYQPLQLVEIPYLDRSSSPIPEGFGSGAGPFAEPARVQAKLGN
jgi:hypothetical protein